MSWSGVERWTRHNERLWLTTLSSAQLAGYLRALPRRAVDFVGQPVTDEFLRDCRLDAARARERGTACALVVEFQPPTPPEESG